MTSDLAAAPPSSTKCKAQAPEFGCFRAGRVREVQKTGLGAGREAGDATRRLLRVAQFVNLLRSDETVISPRLGFVRRLRDKALDALDAFTELPSCFGMVPKTTSHVGFRDYTRSSAVIG